MLTLPNLLTLLRLILVPFILLYLYLGKENEYISNILIAFVLYLFASITDFLDGKIARKYNLTSKFWCFYGFIY